ncbi:uncharacterized protein B0T15DRAFT_493768 [Chaetomium strumarium]|uniref:Uncharacterized protein n=1 Tax=Chaetomium strumarium TaxID=1170767 RepID=A0AAJ0GT17_9PEZI|nr:hypothetical protein B0T15DRAFT_493768 [Chaetomium strumarium]
MPIICKVCHICNDTVKSALDKIKVPYTESKSGSTTIYRVNTSSPSKWSRGSLARMCWDKLQLGPYHEARKNGDTIHCSNVQP